MNRKGFTLIELLVVIAIIAILAAILFPVFMQAKAAGQQSTCQSNMRQIGQAVTMYMQNNNDRFPPTLYMSAQTNNWISAFPDYVSIVHGGNRTVINPYVKNVMIWVCPTAGRTDVPDYGGAKYGTYAYNGWYLGGGCEIVGSNLWGTTDHSPAFMSGVQPSRTVLGLELKPACNRTSPPSGRGETLRDNPWCYWPYSKCPQWRHNSGMNVVFCDGHVRGFKKGDSMLCNTDDRLWNGTGVSNKR